MNFLNGGRRDAAEADKKNWQSTGEELGNGLAKGIHVTEAKIERAAVNAVTQANKSARRYLEIKSPSKRAEREIGKNWALGIGVGFEKYMPVDDMVNSMEDAFADVTGAISPNNYSNNAGGILGQILSAVQGVSMNGGVYLDGRTLVGELVPAIDTALGTQAIYRGRGVR